MKKLLILFFIPTLLFNCFCQSEKGNNPDITSKEIKDHITYLASDQLKGRFTGTPELKMAADYIEEQFQSYGLKPLFEESYSQSFNFISGVQLTNDNYLELKIKGDKFSPDLSSEYIPASFSDNIESEADLVFIGYGISTPSLNYDDYAGIDVKDKIVLALRYNPEYDSPHSQFDEYSSFRQKTTVAREKGARTIIFVNGPLPKTDEDKLMEFTYDGGSAVTGIGTVQIKRNFADQLFESQGLNLEKYQKKISESKTPASFTFKDVIVKIKTGVEEVQKESWNVAGYLEGNDPVLKNEYIVVGAHFDHLGMGETGSLYRGDEPQIHNGADDNASGTTGVIELAEKFANEKDNLKRSIIFVTFSGEELGLLGSAYFVNNPPIPVSQMSTMINMDMIGRLNEKNELIVYGAGTSSGWKELLNSTNSYNFTLAFQDDGYGPSDHSSFYGKNIPVLFFFTGTHPDYHRPSDDADKINFTGEEKILKYVYDITYKVNTAENKTEYVNVPRKESGTSGGWKVYVGTIPDYAANVEGFKISGVNEGSPAQKGGILAGDIMISFGSKKITNIYDYVYALKEHVPGDVVEVVVNRNGEELKLEVELGAR
ncbi:MAG: aminopeptidase [Ignavibacteria bacterium RBG_16_34_14]|nr:MAG: aminopeptidase [Ignavibacteria bacterium RBG_16_34_14]